MGEILDRPKSAKQALGPGETKIFDFYLSGTRIVHITARVTYAFEVSMKDAVFMQIR